MKTNNITIDLDLYNNVVGCAKQVYPNQSRGVFIGSPSNLMNPESFYNFQSNRHRITKAGKAMFASFGPYYKDHKGFIADPLELIDLDHKLLNENKKIVGLFHVHIDFPAAPSRLDIETFTATMPNSNKVWYAILSFLNPKDPDLRIFWIRNKLVQELEVDLIIKKTVKKL